MPDVIRAVLFDFGGVILSSPFEAFNRYEAEAGLPPDTIRRINATNPDANAWAHFERGEVSVAGFKDLFEAEAKMLGFDVDAQRVVDALRGVIRPAMVEALRRCSAATGRAAAPRRPARGRRSEQRWRRRRWQRRRPWQPEREQERKRE